MKQSLAVMMCDRNEWSKPSRATSVPEQAGNGGHQASHTGSPDGLQPEHAQVDPLPETTF